MQKSALHRTQLSLGVRLY